MEGVAAMFRRMGLLPRTLSGFNRDKRLTRTGASRRESSPQGAPDVRRMIIRLPMRFYDVNGGDIARERRRERETEGRIDVEKQREGER